MTGEPLVEAEEQACQDSMRFYRGQWLDPMKAHVENEAFLAMAMALLSIDHLSSAVSADGRATRGKYVALAKTLPGLNQEMAEHLYEAARGGMAHQFVTEKTGGPKQYRRCVRFTHADYKPFIAESGDLVVDVRDFVDAVTEAWSKAALEPENRRRIGRRIRLDVVEADIPAPRGLTLGEIGLRSFTSTVHVSGATHLPDAHLEQSAANRDERRRQRRGR